MAPANNYRNWAWVSGIVLIVLTTAGLAFW